MSCCAQAEGGPIGSKEAQTDLDIAQLIRKVLDIREKETVTLWAFPGIKGCPLAFHQADQGLSECPLWNWNGGEPPPNEPQQWMRGRCEDESWQERWREILQCCRECKGELRPATGLQLEQVRALLFRRR